MRSMATAIAIIMIMESMVESGTPNMSVLSKPVGVGMGVGVAVDILLLSFLLS